MNEYKFDVNFSKNEIITDMPDLVQNDYKSTKLKFTFDKEGRIEFKIKMPNGDGFDTDIENNEFLFPTGLLEQNGKYKIEISVYGNDNRLTNYATHSFNVRNEVVDTDSLVELDDRVPILSNLINEVNEAQETLNGALEDVNTAITETNNLDLDVTKEGKTATVTLTKKDNTTKEVEINDGEDGQDGKDGTSLEYMWQGTSLGIKTDDMQDYEFVNLQGQVGPVGPQGNPFQVKKTYATIQLMIADYDNMQINDYVMISGNIEEEDNAKLFVKTEQEDPVYRWQYLADFSGASGIRGEQGASVTSATINSNGELVLTVE